MLNPKDFISDFLGSLLADLLSGGRFGKMFAKTATEKVTDKKDGEPAKPSVKLGGLLDLSDETAFAAAAADLSTNEQINVFQFLTSGLIDDGTERRFRLMVAYLHQYVGKDAAGNQINLATETLKKFSQMNDQEKLLLCKAVGLDRGLIDDLDRTITSIKEKLLDPRVQQAVTILKDWDQKCFGPNTEISRITTGLRQMSEGFRRRQGG